MSGFALTLTTAGLQALINAAGNGTAAVQIASFGYTQQTFQPSASLTALPNLGGRLNTIAGSVVSPETIHVSVQDASAATYNVYGFGLYLADGTLFGTYADPQGGLIVAKAASSILLLSLDLTVQQGLASAVTFGATDFLDPPASETVVGVTRYATSAEAQAGQLDTAAITPLSLAAALQLFLTDLGLGSAAHQPISAFDGMGAAAAAQGASLQKAANLGDLPNVGAARGALGLGSAALSPVGAFDGAGAAAAVQAASLQKSQNLADVASVPAARANLGLGSAAVQPTTAFDGAGAAAAVQAASLQKAQNLADVASVPAARTNLGLGPLATQAGASALAAVLAALGYTPTNKAGDFFGGKFGGGFAAGGTPSVDAGEMFSLVNESLDGEQRAISMGTAPSGGGVLRSPHGQLELWAVYTQVMILEAARVIFQVSPSYKPTTFNGLDPTPYFGQTAYIQDCPFAPAGQYGAAVTQGGGTYDAMVWWNAHDGRWVIG